MWWGGGLRKDRGWGRRKGRSRPMSGLTHRSNPRPTATRPSVCSMRLALAILLSSSISYGYTVLPHEAIIDSVWDTSVRRLLLNRFPAATPEELDQAHAYAYGGCIIQ